MNGRSDSIQWISLHMITIQIEICSVFSSLDVHHLLQRLASYYLAYLFHRKDCFIFCSVEKMMGQLCFDK